jgi:hypothetical protein
MKPDPCPLCGANRNVVGKVHRCLPLQIVAEPTSTDVANLPSMANEHLANNTPGRNRASTTYRYRNPDKRRTYMRDLMRRRRASGKAAA